MKLYCIHTFPLVILILMMLSGILLSAEKERAQRGPSAEETQCLILINQLRADPVWESERILFGAQGGISGMFPRLDHDKCRSEIAACKPVPPLVHNTYLMKSARNHAAYMIANNITNHDEFPDKPGFTGANPFARIAAVQYPGRPMGEDAYRNAITAWNSHRGFIIDWGPGVDGMQSPRGHRMSCLSPRNREIGIASVRFDSKRFLATCHNFGNNHNVARFVGGVLYDDANRNGRYDRGEGSEGVEILIDSGLDSEVRTQTSSSGSFTIEMSHQQAFCLDIINAEKSYQWKYAAGEQNVWLFSIRPQGEHHQKIEQLLEKYQLSSKADHDALDLWWRSQFLSQSQEQSARIVEATHVTRLNFMHIQAECMRIYSQGNNTKASRVIKRHALTYKKSAVSAWFRDAERSLAVYCSCKKLIDTIRARRGLRVGVIPKQISKSKRMLRKIKVPLFYDVIQSQIHLLDRTLVGK